MPQFLTPDQILDVHRALTQRYGGDPRVRDLELLESAARAPQETRFGEFINKSLRSQAAMYWLSVAINRPFVEGNARTGLVTAEVFLEMNGFQLDLDSNQVQEIVFRIQTRQINSREKMLQRLRIRAL